MIQLLTQQLKRIVINDTKLITQNSNSLTSVRFASSKDKPKKKWIRHKKLDIPIQLLQDVPFVGKEGQIVKVKAGYMRNDLYPKKLAIYVPREHKQICKSQLANQPQSTETAQTKVLGHTYSSYLKLARMERELNRVGSVSFIRATIKLGEPEIYGSVSVEDILNELRKEHKLNIDKDIVSWEKVKKVGTYSFKVNLGNLGVNSLKVIVLPEVLPPVDTTAEVGAQL